MTINSHRSLKVSEFRNWSIGYLPDGWQSSKSDVWTYLDCGVDLPSFGWKVHVSSRYSDTDIVLQKACRIAFELKAPFKYLSGPREFFTLHAKNSSRLQSGKFMALYPSDVEIAKTLMERLSVTLQLYEGLDILTDRPFNNSTNVYYRWGAFKRTGRLNNSGQREELIPDGNGGLVPDSREAVFLLPEGITDPFSNEPAESVMRPREEAVEIDQFRVESVFRYTNSGGRYRGVCMKTGAEVILKEARPHTGFVGELDAVQLLEKEAETLKSISEEFPGLCPFPYRKFIVHDHHYLAMEYIPGTPLSDWFPNENPFLSMARSDDSEIQKYLQRVEKILNKLKTDLDLLHNKGIAFGDLSAGNVIIDEDDIPRLIDFEACIDAHNRERKAGTPDFCLLKHSEDLTAREADLYSYHSIALSAVLRLTSLAEISDHVLLELEAQFLEFVDQLPAWWSDAISYLRYTTNKHSKVKYRESFKSYKSFDETRENLSSSLFTALEIGNQGVKSFLYTAPKTLGDEEYLSFNTGRSGIISALSDIDKTLDAKGRDGYLKKLDYVLEKNLLPTTFGYGVAGLLNMCRSLGWKEQSDRILEIICSQWNDITDPTLDSGLSGIAVTVLGHGKVDLARKIMSKALNVSQNYKWTKNGLLNGRSGVIAGACQFPSLVKDSPYTSSIVQKLIDEELAQTYLHPIGGARTLRGETDGNRFLPYFGDGTAGMLFALILANDNPHIEFSLGREQIISFSRDLSAPFTIDHSLMSGSCGLALMLSFVSKRFPALQDELPEPNWERLKKFLLPCQSGTSVLNPRILKYDFGYNYGSSGILAALSCIDRNTKMNLSAIRFSID